MIGRSSPAHRPLVSRSSPTHRPLVSRSSAAYLPLIGPSSAAHRPAHHRYNVTQGVTFYDTPDVIRTLKFQEKLTIQYDVDFYGRENIRKTTKFASTFSTHYNLDILALQLDKGFKKHRARSRRADHPLSARRMPHAVPPLFALVASFAWIAVFWRGDA